MADTQGQSQSGEKGKGKRKQLGIIIIIIVIVALIAVIGVLAMKLLNGKEEEPAEEEKKSVITAENVTEVLDDLLSEPEQVPAYYTVVQNTDWTFPDGASASTDAYVENDPENETAVYFDVVIDETGEQIYSSPVLELGAKLDEITLDKDLDPGDYDCTMKYHLVDEDQKELSSVDVGVNIHVEN